MKTIVAARFLTHRILAQVAVLLLVFGVSTGAVLVAHSSVDNEPTMVALASWDRDYESISDMLLQRGTIVVVGEVVTVGGAYPVGDGVPFTDSTVEVSEVLFGASAVAPGENLTVRQTGGTAAGRTVELKEARLLKRGERVLLFLTFDDLFKKYAIVGGRQGHYTVERGTVRHANFATGTHPLAAFTEGKTVETVKEMIMDLGKDIGGSR